MSELIGGKEAKLAWANGKSVQFQHDDYPSGWIDLKDNDEGFSISYFNEAVFRLKPRTVNLNGVEVGQLRTAMWCINCPKEVTLEFKTEDDAHHFYANALKIFNGV